MITPYFTTTYTIGRGLWTLDEPAEITDDSPISVFSIAKKYNLPEIKLIESSFTGFIKAYKMSEKTGIPFHFGVKLRICENEEEKTEESFNTESNIVLWILNTKGYSDAIKIYSRAATDGFYYIPRLSWKTLKSMWTENLGLSIPFYSGFIAKNSLYGHNSCPIFPTKPFFHLEDHSLPFDGILRKFTEDYAAQNNYPTAEMHKTLYYKNEDIIAAMTYRILTGRKEFTKTSLSKPELKNFGLDTFSWENYQNKIGNKL